MRGLSCYTANLHAYLAGEWDADALLAQSVRLAVRVDLPDGQLAFSHHDPSLDRLPDGTRLGYTATSTVDETSAGLVRELATYGRVLVVVDSARLPWSVTRGRTPTPHWLLVDGQSSGHWHVVDRFTALLPAGGEQLPHEGWLSTHELCDAMALPPHWEPEQEQRNALAFGTQVPVPSARTLWLRRNEDGLGGDQLTGCWLYGDDQVLPFLMNYLVDHGTGIARHLDDLWAAVGHRGFAYRRRLAGGITERERDALRAALVKWENLPRMLRIAAESAQRGRPRPVLARAALEVLSHAEEGVR
nr:hypothetical protein [Kibdelosporangium sp. MJ126-NF4]CEL13027.1 hypothetical protein [Kibdelosporangium sp. MJ126-NF4]CTQ98713.1 hypothetical protein [Kibdelosporangium sp. MJ126-NF4]